MDDRVVHLRAGRDASLGADHDPPSDPRLRVHDRRRGDPRRLVCHAVDLPVEQIEMGLQVLLGRPQIQPIGIGEEPEHRTTARDHGREDLAFDRDLAVGAPRPKDGRIEDVRPGVDVAGDRIERFLAELDDAATLVGRHQTERARVVHVMQRDRDDGLMRSM